ncbi:MAG: hypothetical protein JJ992_21685, partial [Planctomycetes bacterium]|nr:hypothetical protein [Planctomycetota bacterium]
MAWGRNGNNHPVAVLDKAPRGSSHQGSDDSLAEESLDLNDVQLDAGAEDSESDDENSGADASNDPVKTSALAVGDEADIDEWFLALKRELHQQIIAKMNPGVIRSMKQEELRDEVRRQTESLCQERAELLNASERERLVTEVLDETFGLGPLEQLMRDTDISDILINGPKAIFVE